MLIAAGAIAAPIAPMASAFPRVLDPTRGALFGAVVHAREHESRRDAVIRFEHRIGRRLGIDHQYYKWNDPIPTDQETWDRRHGRIPFMNWKAERDDGRVVPWSAIADGSHDDWIRARADAFRRFSSPVYLTFHHEPEDDLDAFGTPDEYADAFRQIVSIFDEESVTNVAFVWTMMSWTFDSDSGRDLMGYYPGNRYVDLIGVDGYNWHGVRPDEPWRSFAEILAPARAFARSQHKPWIVAEYGVVEDPADPGRKAHWFRAAGRTAQRWTELAGLIYFNVVKDGAHWMSESSPSSLRAFRSIGHREYFNP